MHLKDGVGTAAEQLNPPLARIALSVPPETAIEAIVVAPTPGRVSVNVTVSPSVMAAVPLLVIATVQVTEALRTTAAVETVLTTDRS